MERPNRVLKKTWVESPLHGLQPTQQIHAQKHRISLSFNKSYFSIRTATAADDLSRILQLRTQVFFTEFKNQSEPVGLDRDVFDEDSDHIIIEDERTKKLVGCYRIRCSLYTDRFYSQTEFEMNKFLMMPGIKIELSRACIDPNYRDGVVLSLLWRAIKNYSDLVNAKYLFGCSSVQTTEPREIAAIQKHLREAGVVTRSYHIKPRYDFAMAPHSELNLLEGPTLPGLFSFYLGIGATVCEHPALDLDFKCVDFLTVLEMSNASHSVRRRYAPTRLHATE